MHIGTYIDLVYRAETDLAKAFRKVSEAHGQEPDVYQTCQLLASWSDKLAAQMGPFAHKYQSEKDSEPDRLTKTLLKGTRKGGLALLLDLHDLYLVATEVQVCCTILNQGADGLRDKELSTACQEIKAQTQRQLAWLMTRMKAATPQTLIVEE